MALIDHVAHVARLDVRADDGRPVREHLDGRVRRLQSTKGDEHPDTVAAIRDRSGPPAPVALEYLLRWSNELYGRSGVDANGVSPLTFSTIADWARLTDRDIAPHEVHALLTLDSVRRHPPPETDDDG